MTDDGNSQAITISSNDTDVAQRIVSAAIKQAEKEIQPEDESRLASATVYARAIENVSGFGDNINRATLLLLRTVQIRGLYIELGHSDLVEFVDTMYLSDERRDTVLRLARAVERIFPKVGVLGIEYGDGFVEAIDLIEKASPSALMKLSYAFAQANDETQVKIIHGLLSGSSNASHIKRTAGVSGDILIQARVIRHEDGTATYELLLTPPLEAFVQERMKGHLVLQLG